MVDVALERSIRSPHEFGGIGFGQREENGGRIGIVGVETTLLRGHIGEAPQDAIAVDAVGRAVEPRVGECRDAVEAFAVVATGMSQAKTHLRCGLGNFQNIAGLGPRVGGIDTGVDDERQIEFSGKLQKSTTLLEQGGDVGLDHRGLNFQAVERILLMQFAQLDELGGGFAHGIEHRERQGKFTEIWIELVALVHHALVFKRVGNRLEAAADDLLPPHGFLIEGEVNHHGKDDPAIDAAVAALGDEGGQILGVGMKSVEVEIRIYAEVVVAVDDHGVRRLSEENQSSLGRSFFAQASTDKKAGPID